MDHQGSVQARLLGAVTEYIGIRGARENNFKDVSLRIPKRKVAIRGGEAAWT